MTKQDLTDHIASETGESKAAVNRVVDSMIDKIEHTLRYNGVVNLPPLGKFEARRRNARTGINPQTGEQIQIPAHDVPVFKPSSQLKDAVR